MEWTVLSKRKPTKEQWRDIAFGQAAFERLEPFGATRSIHVKNKTVLSVETVEGLADAIRRSGTICRGGFTVALFFPPSAGAGLFRDEPVDTRILQAMVDAGADTLALSADYPIRDPKTVIAFADRQKIAVVRKSI